MSRENIISTLRDLIERYGIDLLESPMRLDGFLRDLHPHLPREVYLIIEMIESGVLNKMRRGKPHLDSEFNGFAAQLSAKSGTAPTFARWAVQAWRDALPESAYVLEKHTPKVAQQQRWSGSIDAVLMKHS